MHESSWVVYSDVCVVDAEWRRRRRRRQIEVRISTVLVNEQNPMLEAWKEEDDPGQFKRRGIN